MGEVLTQYDGMPEIETERVRRFKLQWLMSAGFSAQNAARLADSRVDWHFAIDTLHAAQAKGRTEDFVMDLLL